jgi:hypothetical protein
VKTLHRAAQWIYYAGLSAQVPNLVDLFINGTVGVNPFGPLLIHVGMAGAAVSLLAAGVLLDLSRANYRYLLFGLLIAPGCLVPRF